MNMVKSIIAQIVSFLRPSRTSEQQMIIWAKTEYGKEWQYAYNYILPNITKNRGKQQS
jgi:hypothetical protein|tara:strand:+ start:15 stop:188 length:174 start_codon:yes stop_codon:yes gene_type:complete